LASDLLPNGVNSLTMILFVGLGNPGSEYARHRHNIGFMVADGVHREHRFPTWRSRFQGALSEGEIAGERVVLLKPQTYMNDSGRSVGDAMRFFKLEPSALIVAHDELDLAPAKLRVKIGGGNAGHNGLRSITAHVGNDYKRLRIGIGHPGDKALVHHYVLQNFAKDEAAWTAAMLEAIAKNFALLVEGKDASFQNKVHLAVEAADPERPGSA
jgi:PTH1 family peptidyl-tRNA hydrolase